MKDRADAPPLRLLTFAPRSPATPPPRIMGSRTLAGQMRTIVDRFQALALKHPIAADGLLDWLDRFFRSNGV